MKFTKSPSTKCVKLEFLEKRSFFFNEKKRCSEEVFLSICFPLDGLSLEYRESDFSSHFFITNSGCNSPLRSPDIAEKRQGVRNYVYGSSE